MEIYKLYSPAKLNVIVKVKEVKCLNLKIRRKTSNDISAEAFSDTAVMVISFLLHIKYVLGFVRSSVAFTALMGFFFFYMLCRWNALRKPYN